MHAEVPLSALDQADSFKVLPVYIVIDHSWATSEALATINDLLIPTVIRECLKNPLLDELLRFTIIGFNDRAEIVSSLASGSTLTSHTFVPSSASTFSDMFRLLRSQLETDYSLLKADGYMVYRPHVFLLADGEPLDEPISEFADLVPPRFARGPHISFFALDPNIRPRTLRSFVAGAKGMAFRRKFDMSAHHAASEFVNFLQLYVIGGSVGYPGPIDFSRLPSWEPIGDES